MRTPEMRSFDTHKYIKELTNSGFEEKQAEIIIKSILESRDYDFSKLATREQVASIEKDIELMRQEMSNFATKEQVASVEKDVGLIRQDMSLMRQDMNKFVTKEQLEAGLKGLESTLLKLIITFFIATWGVVGALLKFFSH